jgi:hypothetical protein
MPVQCVDITFVDPGDERLAEVNETNCFNSNDIGFADVYTIVTRASGQGNATSDGEKTVTFWYFRRHTSAGLLGLLSMAWLPLVMGAAMWML